MKEKMQAPLDAKNAENAPARGERLPDTDRPEGQVTRARLDALQGGRALRHPVAALPKAMENGEVKFIDFGDQRRITDQEIARIRGLHGLSPTPERPDEPPVEAEPLKPPRSSFPKDKPLEAAE